MGAQVTYERYIAYARRVGADPYTRAQWDAMSATQRALIATLIARS